MSATTRITATRAIQMAHIRRGSGRHRNSAAIPGATAPAEVAGLVELGATTLAWVSTAAQADLGATAVPRVSAMAEVGATGPVAHGATDLAELSAMAPAAMAGRVLLRTTGQLGTGKAITTARNTTVRRTTSLETTPTPRMARR